MSDIRFETSSPDLRPALILDHVEDATVMGLSVKADAKAESALRLIDSKDVLIAAPRLLSMTETFLQLEGGSNERITLDGGDVSRAAKALAYASGASEASVKHRS